MAEIQALYDRPDCCVDEHFTDKARIIGGTTAGFNKSMGLKAALRSWAMHSSLTNMGTERLLSLVRRSCPSRCYAERMVAAGYLTQVQQVHRSAGGNDVNKLTRHQLLAAGIPLRAGAKHQNRAKSHGRRPRRKDFTMWANKKLKKERGILGVKHLGNRAAYKARLDRLKVAGGHF